MFNIKRYVFCYEVLFSCDMMIQVKTRTHYQVESDRFVTPQSGCVTNSGNCSHRKTFHTEWVWNIIKPLVAPEGICCNYSAPQDENFHFVPHPGEADVMSNELGKVNRILIKITVGKGVYRLLEHIQQFPDRYISYE